MNGFNFVFAPFKLDIKFMRKLITNLNFSYAGGLIRMVSLRTILSGENVVDDMFTGAQASNLYTIAGVAIFLSQYTMEAVGWTEFVYGEAVHEGMRILTQMSRKGHKDDMAYIAYKWIVNVFNPGWSFHKMYGTLNPYTYPAFEAMYQNVWREYEGFGIQADVDKYGVAPDKAQPGAYSSGGIPGQNQG